MQRQLVALDRPPAGSVLRLPALQCHTRTRYDGSIALNTCSATVPKWLRWRRKRATFKHFECLGFLLRGVPNSRGTDSWCLWLFLSDVPNCCFPLAWVLLCGFLPTSWIAPGVPDWSLSVDTEQSASRTPKKRPLRRRQKTAVGMTPRSGRPTSDLFGGPLLHLHRVVAPQPPEAVSQLPGSGCSPMSKGRLPHGRRWAATLRPPRADSSQKGVNFHSYSIRFAFFLMMFHFRVCV